MKYRPFGKTGLKLPVISMGAGDTDNPKLVEAAMDKGIIMFATSQYYGNGNNEKMLGEVLKTKKRDSFIIATSAMPDGFDHKEGNFTSAANPDAFLKKFEGSLQRLGMEYVDIMFLPFVAKRESVFFEPMLKVMEKIKKDGKARFIGIATHSYEHEAIRAAVDVKIYDLVMTAYNFRKNNLRELNESIDYAAKAGLGIISMKTMAGAYWDKERKQPINTKAALKWVLQNENIHTTVPGITSFDQLQQNIDLMQNLQLTEEEKKDLIQPLASISHGIYCQQCGECIGQCPKSLDIPTIMRSYMYAYGYKNLKHAQETLQLSEISDTACTSCETCKVKCTSGFDIKGKIADIIRLKTIPADMLYC
jgi:predicted aldo/keto reductase-like oxidoreductase